jgi:hypothetical protein
VSHAALTGAKLLLDIPLQAKTQAQAAELVGSHQPYIAAAVALLEAEVPALVESVLRGDVSLLEAAGSVRGRARLVRAYRRATPADRKALGAVIGVNHVFDETIAPSL